jgi:hypothetical protein
MDYEQIMQRDYIWRMVPRHQQDPWPRCGDWDASRLGVRSWWAMLSCGPDHQRNYSIPLQVWQPRNWVLACIYVPPFRPDHISRHKWLWTNWIISPRWYTTVHTMVSMAEFPKTFPWWLWYNLSVLSPFNILAPAVLPLDVLEDVSYGKGWEWLSWKYICT